MKIDEIEIDDADEDFSKFQKTLNVISNLLDFIAHNAFMMVQLEINGNKTYLVQGQALDVARHTLLSVQNCTKRACFSDAFTLVRKFRDDLTQYLFINFSLDRVQGMTKDEADYYFSDITNIERIKDGLRVINEILSTGSRKGSRELAVDSWLDNTLSEEHHAQERKLFFDASKYIAILESDELIKECFENYLRPIWKEIDRTLNNYVHVNGSKYILANLSNYIFTYRKDMLTQLNLLVRDIMVIFLSLVILIKPNFIQSTDYIDSVEMGEAPLEDSQYWVAPIAQDFIDLEIVRLSPGLKQFLKEKNKYGMQIN